ncbi:MAG: hypothetical protein J7639_01335 [Paenibacillaceae bacterium]|nr:hypothetical protein [Paenibacillaceae bacterium]
MLEKERPYAFRRRLDEVHRPDRRDPDARPADGETAVTDDWAIVVSVGASELLLTAALDLQHYLLVSMRVSVPLRRVGDVAAWAGEAGGAPAVVLATKEELPQFGGALTETRSYRLAAGGGRIVICGNEDRGAAQGSYYLEDLMNLRDAPFVREADVTRKPLFAPRMAHSGWGLDQFPDPHLNVLAHAGIDAILVFVEDVDRTPTGYLDFNNLVDRAERYGIDVYMYSYLVSQKKVNRVQPHPDDPGAEAYYERLYGSIMAACPRFKGIVLVGESMEFRSHDPNVAEVTRLEWPEEQVRTKPSPGWWPCRDFPRWVSLVRDTIHRHSPNTEIVFWTYNWGWAPEEERLRLIRELPAGITLQVTFEMFQQVPREGVTHVCVDYTASSVGPGAYFASEAQAARERGMKLYSMSNTGGMTWDFGVIPFEPVPHQWTLRHNAVHEAQRKWGLSGLMENHHYGFWPSFVADLAKWSYWSPSPRPEELYEAIARRDYGAAAAPPALDAWRHWSEAIRDYVPTNEDQYGPFRVGPSYPLVFRQAVKLPEAWHALWGNLIVLTDYKPLEDPRQSPGAARVAVELRALERMLARWQTGNECLEQALPLVPARKLPEARRLLGMNRFIVLTIRTTLHAKRWWLLKMRLGLEPDPVQAGALLDEMARLAAAEIANAEAAIPLVQADSRLGWEPSMDYMTDAAHLRWKIEQVQAVLEVEFPQYRKSLGLCD